MYYQNLPDMHLRHWPLRCASCRASLQRYRSVTYSSERSIYINARRRDMHACVYYVSCNTFFSSLNNALNPRQLCRLLGPQNCVFDLATMGHMRSLKISTSRSCAPSRFALPYMYVCFLSFSRTLNAYFSHANSGRKIRSELKVARLR